jgi:uncharacterized alpha-E superfamily protein
MLRLGRNMERADMTTRVLDVRASSLLGDNAAFTDIQWAGVLKSLSAFQMFRRSVHRPVEADAVIRFCLTDSAFPRSVAHCLDEIASCLVGLPHADEPRLACDEARLHLVAAELDGLVGSGLHQLSDELQIMIGEVHNAVAATYFNPVESGHTSIPTHAEQRSDKLEA